MPADIPNLWEQQEDAPYWYGLFLAHLLVKERHGRILQACQQIREFAASGPGLEAAAFTSSEAIESLFELRDYAGVHRELEWRERQRFGQRLVVTPDNIPPAIKYDIPYVYAPLSYFEGRHDQGRRLLEAVLHTWLGPRVPAFHILFHVVNDDVEPTHRCRVTLSHFYRKLGQPLSEWNDWPRFVKQVDSRLLRLARIPRSELLSDPERLPKFAQRLMAVRDKRVTSGIGGGLSDLTDSAATVRKRQADLTRRREEQHQQFDPARDVRKARLLELFPELGHQPA